MGKKSLHFGTVALVVLLTVLAIHACRQPIGLLSIDSPAEIPQSEEALLCIFAYGDAESASGIDSLIEMQQLPSDIQLWVFDYRGGASSLHVRSQSTGQILSAPTKLADCLELLPQTEVSVMVISAEGAPVREGLGYDGQSLITAEWLASGLNASGFTPGLLVLDIPDSGGYETSVVLCSSIDTPLLPELILASPGAFPDAGRDYTDFCNSALWSVDLSDESGDLLGELQMDRQEYYLALAELAGELRYPLADSPECLYAPSKILTLAAAFQEICIVWDDSADANVGSMVLSDLELQITGSREYVTTMASAGETLLSSLEASAALKSSLLDEYQATLSAAVLQGNLSLFVAAADEDGPASIFPSAYIFGADSALASFLVDSLWPPNLAEAKGVLYWLLMAPGE